MRFLGLSLCLISLTFSNPLFSQNQRVVDSLWAQYESTEITDSAKVFVLGRLVNMHIDNDQAKATAYTSELRKFSTRINNKTGIAGSNLLDGTLHNYYGNLDSATYYYQIAFDQFAAIKDTMRLIRTGKNLAIMEYKKGNYRKAIHQIDTMIVLCNTYSKGATEIGPLYNMLALYNKTQGFNRIALKNGLLALKAFEQNEDKYYQTETLNILAGVEADLKNYEQSIKYHLEAIAFDKENDNLYFLAQSHSDLGTVYSRLKDYDNAEQSFLKAVDLYKETGSTDGAETAFLNLGVLYRRKGQIDKSLSYLEKSLAIVERIGYPLKIAEAKFEFGRYYQAKNQSQKALSYLNLSIELADSIEAIEMLSSAYFERSKVLEKLGNHELALVDFKKYEQSKDTLLNQTKIKEIEELRILHDLDKKEQSIELQQNKITLLEQEATLSRLQKWLLGLGLGFSLLTLGLGYYSFRQKIKRNQLQKEQQKVLYEKELAFKKRELTTHALHLAKKNELLGDLKQKAMDFKATVSPQVGYQKLINTIDFDLQDDNNWENFKHYFEQIHTNFNSTVIEKYPTITPNELRLMSLLKMNLSSKEIANILNVSSEGVKKARQRLRKKLGLQSSDSLEHLVMKM